MLRTLFKRARLYFDRGMFRAFFCQKKYRLFAYGCGTFLVSLLVAETLIALWLNDVFGNTTNILANHKDHTMQEFYTEMRLWFLLSVGNDLIIVVLTSYFTKWYALRWRVAVTEYYMCAWDRTPKKFDGASQRVEKDLPNFINTFLMLVTGLLGSIITLIGFMPMLWILSIGIDVDFLPRGWSGTSGVIVWVLLIGCAGATVISWALGWWLSEIEDQKLEADAIFRRSLVLTEDHEIYPVKDHLRCSPFDHIPLVYRAQMRFFKNIAFYEGWTAIYTLVLEILPYYIGVESLFAGVILYGTIIKISDAFGNVKKSISFFIENRTSFAVMQALHKRLVELEVNLNIHTAP